MNAFNKQQQSVQVAKAAAAVVRFEERQVAEYHNDKFNYDTSAFQEVEDIRVY